MFKIAICDDESIFLMHHKKMTEQILRHEHIAYSIHCFSSIQPLKKSVDQFDLILMDILLKENDGFAFVKMLREHGYQTAVIFCTSTQQYSLDGYSVYPIHYLLKPIQIKPLHDALMHAYKQTKGKKIINLMHREGITKISAEDVLYLEFLNRLTHIYTKNETFLLSCSLHKAWEKYFSDPFFVQCHKSYIVSLYNIQNIRRQGILLQNGSEIPVGRKYYDDVFAQFTREL